MLTRNFSISQLEQYVCVPWSAWVSRLLPNPKFLKSSGFQPKAYIVWDLHYFLPLSVVLWLFRAKPGENGWQGKDGLFSQISSCLDGQWMLQECCKNSVLLSCQVQGVEGGMWKLKLIMKNDIVSCEEESLACFVEIFQWLHCIIHVLSAMNQHIKKKKATQKKLV